MSYNPDTNLITVSSLIKSNLNKVWDYYNLPEHVVNWNFASDDWCCPKAENNLEVGKNFTYTMSAKDGSFSFDFGGIYTKIEPKQKIEYVMGDSRQVFISFEEKETGVLVNVSFTPETENSVERQESGWQSILDNFKKYCETKNN